MSHHYPHHVGKIVPRERAKSERVAELASRYPEITEDEAEEVLTFLRTWRQENAGASSGYAGLRLSHHSFIQRHLPDLRTYWREGAAEVGSILVLLITAGLIGAALAEAASMLANAA
jgi:hypothetical protein